MTHFAQSRFCINFRIKKRVKFGEAIFISGNIQELGDWKVQRAFRLTWNDKDIWTGTLVLNGRIPDKIEYKYVLSLWQGCSTEGAIWEDGDHNRVIYLKAKSNNQIIDDKWNMQKISLNMMVLQNQDVYNMYSVIGNHIQLGNWKTPTPLTKRNHGSKLTLSQIDTDEDSWEDYNIYSYSFEIYRAREKFRYYYIRQANYTSEAERHPGRLFVLGKENSFHPDYFRTVYNGGKIELYEKCNFQLLIFSQVTDKLFLGAYPKSIEDLKLLKSKGVKAILSIQTDDDFRRHDVSVSHFQQVCKQEGILTEVCSIKDMDKADFLQKAEGALSILKAWNALNYVIYIHCSAGIYRSPQIMILHMMEELNYKLQEAIELVKEKHAYANPNIELIFIATEKIRSQKQITNEREISIEKKGHLNYSQENQEDSIYEQEMKIFEHH